MSPASEQQFAIHSLEVLIHDIAVALDGTLEVLQQAHSHAGTPRAVFVEEEPVSGHNVHNTPHITPLRTVLLVVYPRQCTLIYLNIISVHYFRSQQVVQRFEFSDHRLEPIIDC